MSSPSIEDWVRDRFRQPHPNFDDHLDSLLPAPREGGPNIALYGATLISISEALSRLGKRAEFPVAALYHPLGLTTTPPDAYRFDIDYRGKSAIHESPSAHIATSINELFDRETDFVRETDASVDMRGFYVCRKIVPGDYEEGYWFIRHDAEGT